MSLSSLVRIIRPWLLAVVLLVSLSACGFHLRRSAKLPPQMARVHLTLGGGSLNFRRALERNLSLSGVVLEDASGPGIAELKIPVAQFTNDSLSLGGYVQITEYALHFIVLMELDDAKGEVVMGQQRIDLQREYTTDAYNNVGNDSQVQQMKSSMSDDMVRSIMLRLEAAGRHPQAAKASDPSAVAPLPEDENLLPGSRPVN